MKQPRINFVPLSRLRSGSKKRRRKKGAIVLTWQGHSEGISRIRAGAGSIAEPSSKVETWRCKAVQSTSQRGQRLHGFSAPSTQQTSSHTRFLRIAGKTRMQFTSRAEVAKFELLVRDRRFRNSQRWLLVLYTSDARIVGYIPCSPMKKT